MRRTRLLSILLTLTSAALACARADEAFLSVTHASTATPPQNEAAGLRMPQTSSPANVEEDDGMPGPESPQPAYDLTARIDPDERRIEVQQRVSYTNTSGAPLDLLCFVVEANREPDVFQLDYIRGGDGALLESYRIDGAQLWVPLPQPLPDAGVITLELDYKIFPPEQRKPFGFTDRQLNLVDWYPYIPPHNADGGWVIHEPASVGEHLVYPSADFHAELHLEASLEGWTLAAPTSLPERGDSFEIELQNARDLALSLSQEFIKLETGDERFSVSAYVFPEHAFAGRHALDVALRSLQLYSELFGPPPQGHLTIVEADFPDGRECSSLFFLDQFYFEEYAGHPRGWLTPLTAHETSHQWWFNLVGNDPALEPWLDEALATYSERLYFERYHPDLLTWWWAFRVQTFAPTGYVDSTIYEHEDFRAYVDAIYLRGASLYEALSTTMGETAFLNFLQTYASDGAYRVNTSQDLLRVLQASTDAELQTLYHAFFKHPPEDDTK